MFLEENAPLGVRMLFFKLILYNHYIICYKKHAKVCGLDGLKRYKLNIFLNLNKYILRLIYKIKYIKSVYTLNEYTRITEKIKREI